MTPQHTPSDPVARQLIADAQSLTPSYSERLHQRTMRAVRAQQTRMIAESRSGWTPAIAAAAAVLLLGLTAWYFAGGQLPSTPQLVATRGPVVGVDVGIPDASDLLRHGSAPLKSAINGLDQGSIVQLEQDARSLARFLANQLPQSDPRAAGKTDRPM